MPILDFILDISVAVSDIVVTFARSTAETFTDRRDSIDNNWTKQTASDLDVIQPRGIIERVRSVKNIGFLFDRSNAICRLILKKQSGNEDDLFPYIRKGDLDGLETELETIYEKSGLQGVKDAVLKCDVGGGNIIHYAYYIKKYEIGRWLVRKYPCEALAQYSDDCTTINKLENLDVMPEEMPFTGINILHLVLYDKNIDEARWLLEYYFGNSDVVNGGFHSILHAYATGNYYRITSTAYCGSYPIQFAAVTNNIDIFNLLSYYHVESAFKCKYMSKDKPSICVTCGNDDHFKFKQDTGVNAIFFHDRYGNNCLHLCSIRRIPQMYKHIKTTALEAVKSEFERESNVSTTN